MSNSTTVSQQNLDSSNKKELTSSTKFSKSSSKSSGRDKKEEKAQQEILIKNENTSEKKTSEKKDKKDENNNMTEDSSANNIIGYVENNLSYAGSALGVFGNMMFSSYMLLKEVPVILTKAAQILRSELSKVLSTAQELTDGLVYLMWGNSIRKLSNVALKSVNMSLYRGSPSRIAFGKNGAKKIWDAYGIWTTANVEANLNNLVNDLDDIFTSSGLSDHLFVISMLDKLKSDLAELENIDNDNRQKKEEKIVECFGLNFFSCINLYKQVASAIDREGFDHDAFANNLMNAPVLNNQYNPSNQIVEWVESVLDFINHSSSSLLPTSGVEVNKILPYEYQAMAMFSYATANLNSDDTPPRIFIKELFISTFSRKLLLSNLINRLLTSMSQDFGSDNISISNELLKDAITCIVASIFKNIYKPDSKIQVLFSDMFQSIKNSMMEKKNK